MGDQRAAIEAAGRLLADMEAFAIIGSIAEGGHISSASYTAADRINRIAQAEMSRLYRAYEREVAKAQALSGKAV